MITDPAPTYNEKTNRSRPKPRSSLAVRDPFLDSFAARVSVDLDGLCPGVSLLDSGAVMAVAGTRLERNTWYLPKPVLWWKDSIE